MEFCGKSASQPAIELANDIILTGRQAKKQASEQATRQKLLGLKLFDKIIYNYNVSHHKWQLVLSMTIA